MRAPTATLAVIVSSWLAVACGRSVDLSRTLEVRTVSSGWIDAGGGGGKTRLVPTISFTLKNGSDHTLPLLQVNALFGRVGDDDEWGSRFVTAAHAEGLAPGAIAGPLTATSPVGYTGVDSRTALLGNSQFVDARVDLFAKYGSAQWTRLGRFRIPRELLAR